MKTLDDVQLDLIVKGHSVSEVTSPETELQISKKLKSKALFESIQKKLLEKGYTKEQLESEIVKNKINSLIESSTNKSE